MADQHAGQTVVIFVSQRTAADVVGYAEAAATMERLARAQPGYRGIVSVRDTKGLGITISYWADEASAIAWRHDAEHTMIRAVGRERWYDSYEVIVAKASQSYRWSTATSADGTAERHKDRRGT